MSKSNLIDNVADRLNMSKSNAAAAIDAVAEALAQNVGEKGETVRLPPLGSFTRKHKPARTGRNPQTGESIQILARDVIVFKPSKGA